MAKKRIDSFDILKSVSIFLVVFCHFTVLADTVAENFLMTICFVGVPIFFMVNGALLVQRPLDIKNHLKKTFFVYLIGVIWRVIYLVVDVAKLGAWEELLELKQETLGYLIFWTKSSFTAPNHMWFTSALLAIYLIFPAISLCYHSGKPGKNALRLMLAVLFFGVIFCTEGNAVITALNQYFSADIAVFMEPAAFMPFANGSAIFYFLLGVLLWDFLNGSEERKGCTLTARHRIVAAVAFIGSWVLMMWTKSWTDGTWNWTGATYASGYSRLPTLLAVVSLFVLCFGLTIKPVFLQKLLQTVSGYSLGIYYIHVIVLAYMRPLFPVAGLWPNTLKTVIGLAVSCVVAYGLGHVPVIKRLVK